MLIKIEIGWAYWGARHKYCPPLEHLTRMTQTVIKHNQPLTHKHMESPTPPLTPCKAKQTQIHQTPPNKITHTNLRATTLQVLSGGLPGRRETDAGGGGSRSLNPTTGCERPLWKEEVREINEQTKTWGTRRQQFWTRGPNTTAASLWNRPSWTRTWIRTPHALRPSARTDRLQEERTTGWGCLMESSEWYPPADGPLPPRTPRHSTERWLDEAQQTHRKERSGGGGGNEQTNGPGTTDWATTCYRPCYTTRATPASAQWAHPENTLEDAYSPRGNSGRSSL